MDGMAQNEGSLASPANARDEGLGVGASYAVAPGLNLFLEDLFGNRQENGVNLKSGQQADFNSRASSSTLGPDVAFN